MTLNIQSFADYRQKPARKQGRNDLTIANIFHPCLRAGLCLIAEKLINKIQNQTN